jgi:hypothetical protein
MLAQRFFAALALVAAIAGVSLAQEPESLRPVDKAQIEAAHKLTKEAAGKYEFVLGDEESAKAVLETDPILRWSNPQAGEIHGNVFLWMAEGRPAVVSSIFKWFSPHTHMSHEFHSLSEKPLRGRYEGAEVWVTSAPGVRFAPVPEAPAPAASAPQRLLQMRQLAKGFSATKTERNESRIELRLLPQPIYRYAASKQDLLDGALFSLVQGTDPEMFLLLEARGPKDAPRWMFAPMRMNSVGFQLRYQNREIWSAEIMPSKDVYSHREIYTSFMHKMP